MLTDVERFVSKELETFRTFAKHHPAGLDVGSARKAPEPEPDIECNKLDGSGALAFEMVEVVDERLYKDTADQVRLEKNFHRSYESMPAEAKARLQSKYQNTALHVVFHDGLSFQKRNQTIPSILSYLDRTPRLEHKHIPSDRQLKLVVRKIVSFYTGLLGPRLSVHAGGAIGDPLIDRLREKMEERSYKTPWSMELVAYYHLQIEPPEVSWLAPAVQYVRARIKSSSFNVVWIYAGGTDKLLARIP